jgi:hypothetical protein
MRVSLLVRYSRDNCTGLVFRIVFEEEVKVMNPKINRAFLEAVSAYLEGTIDTEADRQFKNKMEEMDGASVRVSLVDMITHWQSLPKEKRILLADVEEIDRGTRLTNDVVAEALASTAPLPTVAPGIRSSSIDAELSVVPEHNGLSLPSGSSVIDPLPDIIGGILPGTVVAKYRVDWAGVYCVKETPWDQGSSSDEVYVIFTTMQPFRKPWTLKSNIEEDWDSGDDWGPFPPMSLFGEKGPEAPSETAITATVMEHDFGDPDKYRDYIHAIATAAQAYAASQGIPIPDVAVDIVTDIVNGLLGTGDDHLGTATVVIDPVQMIWLAQQPLKHYKIQLNYHLVSTHTGDGAKYQVFYRIVQGSNGPVFKWTNIGGPVKELFVGGAGLFATNPLHGDIYRFEGEGKPWTKVGGPGAEFAVTNHHLFGLLPDRSAVYKMVSPEKWEKVGGLASHIVGGGQDLYGQAPGTNGAIWKFDGTPNKWTKVGGPGSEFVANNLTLYGLNPNRSGVYEYLGTPEKWRAIGGPASKIVAGGSFLFALTPDGKNIWRYEGQPFKWTKIGGPGHSFAACDAGLFGLAPDKTGIWWHVGPPDQWICVGTAAGSIAAAGPYLYAASPTFQGVYMLE